MALFLVASGYTFYRQLQVPVAAASIVNKVNTVTGLKETVGTPVITTQPSTNAYRPASIHWFSILMPMPRWWSSSGLSFSWPVL